ncbi:MAG TPA: SRPBCC family protein [Allosphingosinicella sp.]|nr:SRPBCC family protein [Allosphingosinicella sp.]
MAQDQKSLPAGAGALTAPADARLEPTRGGGNEHEARSNASLPEASSGASPTETGRHVYRAAHQEVVVAQKTRSAPSATTIIGAAVAGAIAGGAIPFLLSGRASSRGAAASEGAQDTLVVESVIIALPARQIYDFWRDFTNLSKFMENIKSVEKLSDTRSHWVIKAPAGMSVEFDSHVIDDVPGRSISWESEKGASVPNRGRVEFIETSSGNGTNVRVTFNYYPPAGAAGRVLAKLFQREPSIQAREDLVRLKQLLEGGAAAAA